MQQECDTHTHDTACTALLPFKMADLSEGDIVRFTYSLFCVTVNSRCGTVTLVTIAVHANL